MVSILLHFRTRETRKLFAELLSSGYLVIFLLTRYIRSSAVESLSMFFKVGRFSTLNYFGTGELVGLLS
jgi:hypothetical protein